MPEHSRRRVRRYSAGIGQDSEGPEIAYYEVAVCVGPFGRDDTRSSSLSPAFEDGQLH